MRIRSIKPDFWRSERVAALDLDCVYDGPLPRGHKCYARNLPGVRTNSEYVYFLFGVDDALIYVGRAWRVADRLTKHRRRSWWPMIERIALVQVRGGSSSEAERSTRLLEALAIQELGPTGNLAPASKAAMK